MAQKACISTILPLQNALHLAEESGRDAFWQKALGESPVPWAKRMLDLFEKDDRLGADLLLADMHDKATRHGREYLMSILMRAAA